MKSTKDLIASTQEESAFWNIPDELKGKTLQEIQEIQQGNTLPYAVCVLNLTGDLNVGMIVRTACVFGAKEAIIFGRRKYDKRSTVGAQNYMPVSRVDGFVEGTEILDVEKFRAMLKEKGYYPIFVEQGGQYIETIYNPEWMDVWYEDGPLPCLVFGNENEGVPPEFLKLGITVSILQRGVLRSLNVSSAAAIAIHFFSGVFGVVEARKREMAEAAAERKAASKKKRR